MPAPTSVIAIAATQQPTIINIFFITIPSLAKITLLVSKGTAAAAGKIYPPPHWRRRLGTILSGSREL